MSYKLIMRNDETGEEKLLAIHGPKCKKAKPEYFIAGTSDVDPLTPDKPKEDGEFYIVIGVITYCDSDCEGCEECGNM